MWDRIRAVTPRVILHPGQWEPAALCEFLAIDRLYFLLSCYWRIRHLLPLSQRLASRRQTGKEYVSHVIRILRVGQVVSTNESSSLSGLPIFSDGRHCAQSAPTTSSTAPRAPSAPETAPAASSFGVPLETICHLQCPLLLHPGATVTYIAVQRENLIRVSLRLPWQSCASAATPSRQLRGGEPEFHQRSRTLTMYLGLTR